MRIDGRSGSLTQATGAVPVFGMLEGEGKPAGILPGGRHDALLKLEIGRAHV